MFEALSDRLDGIFTRLRGRGRLSPEDVDEALREIRMALLQADVNLPGRARTSMAAACGPNWWERSCPLSLTPASRW